MKALITFILTLAAVLVALNPNALTQGNVLSDNTPAVSCHVNNIWGNDGMCK